MEQLGSHWKNFHEILCVRILGKSFLKIQVLLKSDKNKEYLMWRPVYVYDNISLNSS